MIKRMVGTFALTSTVGYGVLFYTFGVLIAPMAADLGSNLTTITGALTVSILVTAAATVPVGRWLDRRGARGLMTIGSVLATVSVFAWSQVRTVWQLYLVFVLIGLSSAAVLYEACFAVIVKHAAPAARDRYILTVTIVAGFAGTIFVPTTGLLSERFGWRIALLILGGVLGLLTVLPHFAVVPRDTAPAAEVGPGISVKAALRDPVFWLLSVAFTANGAAVVTVAVHLFAYLRGLGHPAAAAAVVAGLTGVMSVTGRLVTAGLARRFGTATVVSIVFAGQAVAAMLLPVAGRNLTGAILCVLAFGLGFGVLNIAKPALLADRYGVGEFGGISGAAMVPITLARAIMPVAVAALSLSFLPVFAAVACLIAAVCLAATRAMPGSAAATPQPLL